MRGSRRAAAPGVDRSTGRAHSFSTDLRSRACASARCGDRDSRRCSTAPAAASAIRSSPRSLRERFTTASPLSMRSRCRLIAAVLERVPDVDAVLVDDAGDERGSRRGSHASTTTPASSRGRRAERRAFPRAAIPVRVGQARRFYSFRFTDRVVVRSELGDVTSHWSDDSARFPPRDRLRYGRPSLSLRADAARRAGGRGAQRRPEPLHHPQSMQRGRIRRGIWPSRVGPRSRARWTNDLARESW